MDFVGICTNCSAGENKAGIVTAKRRPNMNFCSTTVFLPEKYCGYGITPKAGKNCLLSLNRQGMPTGLLKDSSGCRTNESALKE